MRELQHIMSCQSFKLLHYGRKHSCVKQCSRMSCLGNNHTENDCHQKLIINEKWKKLKGFQWREVDVVPTNKNWLGRKKCIATHLRKNKLNFGNMKIHTVFENLSKFFKDWGIVLWLDFVGKAYSIGFIRLINARISRLMSLHLRNWWC